MAKKLTRQEFEEQLKKVREEIGKELQGLLDDTSDKDTQRLISEKKKAVDRLIKIYIDQFNDQYPIQVG